jgi:SAM-dependent methyltransferase
LELGSGTGYATERILLRNPAARITCLDLSAEMLAAAQAKPALHGVQFVQGDIRADWPKGGFDLVFSTLCLHHLSRTERREVVHRIRATLSPNGRFINGDIFKPATRWEERLLRERWQTSLRTAGLSPLETCEMLAKRRRNMPCFDTFEEHRAALEAADFRHVLCPWTCEMAGVFVGFRGSAIVHPQCGERFKKA